MQETRIYFLAQRGAIIQSLFKLWWGLKGEEIAQAATLLGGE